MRVLRLVALSFVLIAAGGGEAAAATDSLVTKGSPLTPFPQNKQNEPAVAIDPANTSIVAAGANEEIDNLPCAGSDCSFTPGVGGSGVYLSFDGGTTWAQPTYMGLSGRSGVLQQTGPIGTVPNYEQAGLVSDGDPTLAFGPRPGRDGRFSWTNGERLYYGNLTANLNAKRTETFAGAEAVAVSHTDDLAGAALGANSSWSAPVIVTKQNSALFSDKPNVWDDDAASSRFFGNVYECNIAFRSIHGTSEPLVFSRSVDGGATFSGPIQLTAATGTARQFGRQGCAVRTDSTGTVYVFWQGAIGGQIVQEMDRSFDGGRSFEKPHAVQAVTGVGVFDPVQNDITFDGVTGARTNSFPSVDIANGAPTGADATNVIAMTWSDARAGLDRERALTVFSGDRGATWTTPVNATESGDRPDFPAVALAPDGSHVYLVYDAFLQPFQTDNSVPRMFQGVVRTAALSGTSVSPFTTLHRGETGDARASSANALDSEFLGDYNYVEATRSSATAVWNDARRGADCITEDAYRDSEAAGSPLSKPAPASDCPATFGNTDIFGGKFTP